MQERAACLNKETPQAALIAACTVVIDADKDRPAQRAAFLFNRGEAYREKGDLDNAIKDLGGSIDLDGKNAVAFFNRAPRFAPRAELDAAIADLRSGDQDRPQQCRRIYSTRSHAYYEKHDYERAIADLTQAIRLNPRNTLTIYNRAMAYRAKGEPERAVPDFDLVLKINPADAFAITTAGWPIATCATTTAPSATSTRR